MKVTALYDNGGPGFHRVFEPLRALAGDDIEVTFTDTLLPTELEKGVDLVFMNRIPPKNALSQVLKWKRHFGFKMIVDLDDHWDLDAHHILHDFYKKANLANYLLCAIIDSDAVTVTHERLAAAVSTYNKNVWVHPNAINPKSEYFQPTDTRSDKVRLFWAGGITHEKDIAILRNPIRRVAADGGLSAKVKMIMGGYQAHHKEWVSMASVYTNGGRMNSHVINGRPVTEYYSMYDLADICLVPLLTTKFNSQKSNLKILEAANHGLPVIVSNVDPYLGFPDELVNYVRVQPDWYRFIRQLVNDKEYRELQGAALKDYCANVYNFERINESRRELLLSICDNTILKP